MNKGVREIERFRLSVTTLIFFHELQSGAIEAFRIFIVQPVGCTRQCYSFLVHQTSSSLSCIYVTNLGDSAPHTSRTGIVSF